MKLIALHGHSRAITRVKYNRDGDLLFSTAKDTSPTVWSAETGERLGTYEGHQGAVWDIDTNFTSTLVATAGADQCTKLWNLLTGECVATIPHKTPVRVVQFSHGDAMLLTVGDTSFGSKAAIHIFNLPDTTPEGIKQAKTEYNPWFVYETTEKITSALWGPTNDFIYFASDDGSIVKLDVHTKKELFVGMQHRDEVRRIAFDKEYTTLLSVSLDKTGRLWDAKDLKPLKVYDSDKPLNDGCISPLMNQVILGGGQDARDVALSAFRGNKFETRFFHKVYAEELGAIASHFGPVNSLAFAPDGRAFVSGGEDGLVKIHKFDEDYFAVKD